MRELQISRKQAVGLVRKMRAFQPADRRFPARHEIRELTELPELARRYLRA